MFPRIRTNTLGTFWIQRVVYYRYIVYVYRDSENILLSNYGDVNQIILSYPRYKLESGLSRRND